MKDDAAGERRTRSHSVIRVPGDDCRRAIELLGEDDAGEAVHGLRRSLGDLSHQPDEFSLHLPLFKAGERVFGQIEQLEFRQ